MERRAGRQAHPRPSNMTQGQSDSRPSPRPHSYPSRGRDSYKGFVRPSLSALPFQEANVQTAPPGTDRDRPAALRRSSFRQQPAADRTERQAEMVVAEVEPQARLAGGTGRSPGACPAGRGGVGARAWAPCGPRSEKAPWRRAGHGRVRADDGGSSRRANPAPVVSRSPRVIGVTEDSPARDRAPDG